MVEYNQVCKVLSTVLSGFTILIAFSWLYTMRSNFEPTSSEQKKNARKKATNKLQILGKNKLKLTEYELLIASNLIVPSEIDVDWNDIAGLGDVLQEIKEVIIFPITRSKLLASSKLSAPPKGVLLHGPPGCGKTLIAKATAKEAAATFINLDISMLTDKWYGESQKLVAALFSLAEKLQPTIIFIDEVDCILRTRDSRDHEATAMMKAQFMLLWDGLRTDSDKIIIVMGATNRPEDIDSAILRRMPATFNIPLPNFEQRKEILRLIMSKEDKEDLDFDVVAELTNNYSGSDLRELCRIASLYRVRELAHKMSSDSGSSETPLRLINMDDFYRALKNVGLQK